MKCKCSKKELKLILNTLLNHYGIRYRNIFLYNGYTISDAVGDTHLNVMRVLEEISASVCDLLNSSFEIELNDTFKDVYIKYLDALESSSSEISLLDRL